MYSISSPAVVEIFAITNSEQVIVAKHTYIIVLIPLSALENNASKCTQHAVWDTALGS